MTLDVKKMEPKIYALRTFGIDIKQIPGMITLEWSKRIDIGLDIVYEKAEMPSELLEYLRKIGKFLLLKKLRNGNCEICGERI